MSDKGSGVTIRDLLQTHAAALTPSERKLARALQAAYPIAGLEPLSKLATRASVSPPTALRLLAKLGFDGYPAFQQQLREEVQIRIDSPSKRYKQAIQAADGGAPLAEFEALVRNLEVTAETLDSYELNAVVELLADSGRRVFVLGGVVSRVLAAHLVHRLSQLRPEVRLLPEAGAPILGQVVDLHRRDLLVAFDYKRYQRDTNAFLRRAARKKVTVILCTDPFHLCPALDVASHMLTFSLNGPPPFDSPIGGFALVEALASRVAARLGDAGRMRIASLEEEDSDWMWDRTLLNGIVADSSNTAAVVPRARKPSHELAGPPACT